MNRTGPIFHILPMPSDPEKQPLHTEGKSDTRIPLVAGPKSHTTFFKRRWPGLDPDLGSGPDKPKWLLPPFLIVLTLLAFWLLTSRFDNIAIGGIRRDSKNWCDQRLTNAKFHTANYTQPTTRGYPNEWERWSSNASFPLDSHKMLRLTVPSYVDGEVVISRLTSKDDEGSIVMQSWWTGEQDDLNRLGETGLWIDQRAVQLVIKSDPMEQMVYHRIHIILPANLSTVPHLLSNLPVRIAPESTNITFSDLALTSNPCPSSDHHFNIRERNLSGEYNISSKGVIAFQTDKADIDVDVNVIHVNDSEEDVEYEPRNRLDPRVEVSGAGEYIGQRAYYPFRHYPRIRKSKNKDHQIGKHRLGSRVISSSDSGSNTIRVHTFTLPSIAPPIKVDTTSDSGNISILFPDRTPKTHINAQSDSGNISIILASDISTSASINTVSESGNTSIVLANHNDQTIVDISSVSGTGSVNISDPDFLGHFRVFTQTGGFYVGVEDTEKKVVDVKDKMGGIMGGTKEGDVSFRRGDGEDGKLGHVEVITDSGDVILNF